MRKDIIGSHASRNDEHHVVGAVEVFHMLRKIISRDVHDGLWTSTNILPQRMARPQ